MGGLKIFLTLTTILSISFAQQEGHQTPQQSPQLSWSQCQSSNNCQQQSGKVVIDSNWRWTHKIGTYQPNCYDGNSWNSQLCSDVQSCGQNCAIDGINSQQHYDTYHVETAGDTLELGFVTQGPYSKNVGSRTYLLQDDHNYQMFKLKNREFTFDVDVSQLVCGLNGALYFVEMPQDGGMGQFQGNKIGAQFGTGYCDAQCPHDIKWINGEANLLGWKPSGPSGGIGKYGSCCNEMDIWEANSQSTQITPHSCSVQGQSRCEGTDCGDNPNDRYKGVCDKDGCDFNPFRLGDTNFYGQGSSFTVNTEQKMTVVTQFITDNNQDDGNLSEIKRFYVQNGKVIPNPTVNVGGKSYNSVTQNTCDSQKQYFNETNSFKSKGGMTNMGGALGRGMVLVMSIWDDSAANMLWLDSDYPLDQQGQPGNARGPCPTSSGVPQQVEQEHPNAKVVFSNIKFGQLNSTFTPNQVISE